MNIHEFYANNKGSNIIVIILEDIIRISAWPRSIRYTECIKKSSNKIVYTFCIGNFILYHNNPNHLLFFKVAGYFA